MDNVYVYYDKEFSNQNELFDFMSNELVIKGIVKPTYRKSIEERENLYPTGLKLQELNVAIVHTSSEHSNKEAVCIVNLIKPVTFRNAEDFKNIDVKLVIGLIFVNGEDHIHMLQRIATLLQDNEVIHQIKTASSEQNLKHIMTKYLGGETYDRRTYKKFNSD